MNRCVFWAGVIIVAFAAGFLCGKQCHARKPTIEAVSVKPVPGPSENEKDSFLRKFDFEHKRTAFSETKQAFLKHREELYQKIGEVEKVINHCFEKAQDDENAGSIEESVVYEGQFRSSLMTLVGLEKLLVSLYDDMMNKYEEFFGSLTATPTVP